MEKKERVEIIGKSLLLIILIIVISIFAWFFYGVVTVNASMINRGWCGSEATFNTNGNTYQEYNQSGNNCLTTLIYADTGIQINNTTGKDYTIDFENNVGQVYNNTDSLNYTIEGGTIDGNWNFTKNESCYVTSKISIGADLVIGHWRKVQGYVVCKNIKKTGTNYPAMRIRFVTKPDTTTGHTFRGITGETFTSYNGDTTTNTNQDIIDANNDNTASIINNNNTNTENIMNNQDENAEDIMNNQNENTEKEIESQKVCKNLNHEIKYNNLTDKGYLNATGSLTNNENWRTSDYIEIGEEAKVNYHSPWNVPRVCVFDEDYVLLECRQYVVGQNNFIFSVTGQKYIKISVTKERTESAKLISEICENGNQALNDSIWDFSEKLMNGENWEHEDPDDTAQDELEDYESDLDSYLIDDTDISELEYSIDVNTNTAIWGIFNRLVTGNQIFYTGFLTILFLGIIKLVLAR